MSDQYARQSARIHLHGAPTEVFPLFTPLGEYLWVPGWNPELVYPPGGEAMPDNVFVTRHGSEVKTWITVTYDPAALRAEYVNFAPGSYVERVEVQCSPAEGETDALVSYARVATAEAGYAAVAELTQAAHHQRLHHWEIAINHYLSQKSSTHASHG